MKPIIISPSFLINKLSYIKPNVKPKSKILKLNTVNQTLPSQNAQPILSHNNLLDTQTNFLLYIDSFTTNIKEEIALSFTNSNYKIGGIYSNSYLPSIFRKMSFNRGFQKVKDNIKADIKSIEEKIEEATRTNNNSINIPMLTQINKYNNEILNTIEIVTNVVDIFI
jgi:hypothetical protein